MIDPYTSHWTNEGTLQMAIALEKYLDKHGHKWIDESAGENGFVLEIVNNDQIRISRVEAR